MNLVDNYDQNHANNSKDFSVTPWEVEGDVDYGKLIVKFGTQPITPELSAEDKEHDRRDSSPAKIRLLLLSPRP